MGMFERFWREVTAIGLPSAGPLEVIRASRVEALPETAQRYLRFMGVVGRAQDWSFRISFQGRFRTGPARPWMKCQTWQYNNRLATARIFHIKMRFFGLLPVIARDTYISGLGRMLVKAMDTFTLADGRGDEYDIGELVTYLNDAVLICPGMLFTPEITWTAVDRGSFDISMKSYERTVTARVMVDADGAPTDFVSTDRYCEDPENPRKLMQARWSTPIDGWQEVGGRKVFTRGRAVWHLDSGTFEYGDFSPVLKSLQFNVRARME